VTVPEKDPSSPTFKGAWIDVVAWTKSGVRPKNEAKVVFLTSAPPAANRPRTPPTRT
jgi:hypothetical protein